MAYPRSSVAAGPSAARAAPAASTEKYLTVNAPDVVRAMPVMVLETMGTSGWIDGMGVYFHGDCFPHGVGDFSIVDS